MKVYCDDLIEEEQLALLELKERITRITGTTAYTWWVFQTWIQENLPTEYVVYLHETRENEWILLTALPEIVSLVKAYSQLRHGNPVMLKELPDGCTVPDWYTNREPEPLPTFKEEIMMPPKDYDHPDSRTGHERSVSDMLAQQEREEKTKDDMARLIYAALQTSGEVNVRVRGTENVFTLHTEVWYGLRQYMATNDGSGTGWVLLNKADALEWFRELELIVEF